MKRILVPLDGSAAGEAIVPDAQVLAGPDGELILIHDIRPPSEDDRAAADLAENYLDAQVEQLQALGVRAQAQALTFANVAAGIDRAAEAFGVDAIACATHGRTAWGRLIHGGVAWSMLAHSAVPALLRNVGDPAEVRESSAPRGILVPLDGSAYAEKALPLARRLADQWSVPITLVQMLADLPAIPSWYGPTGAVPVDYTRDRRAVQAYLDEIARSLGGTVRTEVRTGAVVECLVDEALKPGISHVVMASHGRTALARVIMGSVTDALLQTIHRPVVVVPALAAAPATVRGVAVPGGV